MKKIISLFSLLLLLSAASLQANVFGRFAQRARQSANKMYDRVPADTLRKAARVADVAFVGLATYSCGKMLFRLGGMVGDEIARRADKQRKTDEHPDITLQGQEKSRQEMSGSASAAQETTQEPESSNSEFKKRVAELREYAITSGLYDADTYDNLEWRMKDHMWVQCVAEKIRAKKKTGKEWSLSDCSAERTSLFPFEAGVAAKKRMLEEREKSGPVMPVKMEVVSVNGQPTAPDGTLLLPSEIATKQCPYLKELSPEVEINQAEVMAALYGPKPENKRAIRQSRLQLRSLQQQPVTAIGSW
jgi:hypothetical protein